jgi:hypothetical protein
MTSNVNPDDLTDLLIAYYKNATVKDTENFKEFMHRMNPAIDIFLRHKEDLYDKEDNSRWIKDFDIFQELKAFRIGHQKKPIVKLTLGR